MLAAASASVLSGRNEAMPTPIHRDRLLALLEGGATLIEVLPVDEYEYEHIPGARNIPLKQLTAATTADVARDNSVVVYCADGL